MDEKDNNTSSREELERYLEEVQRERSLREERLRMLNATITQIEFELNATGAQKLMLKGDVSQIRESESFRKQLKRKLEEQLKLREEAQSDLKRADERLEVAQQELEELQGTERA